LVLCWMRKAHLFGRIMFLVGWEKAICIEAWMERASARTHTHTHTLSLSFSLRSWYRKRFARLLPCVREGSRVRFRQATRSFRDKERDLPLCLWCTIPLVLVHKTAEPCSWDLALVLRARLARKWELWPRRLHLHGRGDRVLVLS
jgi:hypothetical protein